MESTKNLCAQVPISLHEKIRAKQEQSGQTLSQYITQIITEYYERGTMKNMSDSRTMAIQISDELFERLKSYLKTNGISQKQFLTELIEKALDEANA
jgi:predicted DNA-binding protein